MSATIPAPDVADGDPGGGPEDGFDDEHRVATEDDSVDLSHFRRRPVLHEPLGYLAPLDGLRALAVLAVVLYHSHFPWIPGGFLGVSAFFTLSGFLITSLLLREWANTSTVDLRTFWTRRFRRLLPASWITMGLILCFGAVGVWNSDQLRAVRSDLPYSLLEIVNWHFIAADRSYGAEFTAPSPFAHFWSLAVEQQFYILLPVVAVGVLTLGRTRFSRERLNRLIAVFVVLTVVSAVANWWFARTSIDRAYYGTDTRMAELLIGSLLATFTVRRLRLPAGRARGLVVAIGLAAAVVSLWLWHEAALRSQWLYPWGLLLTALCTASIIYAAVQGGAMSKVLTFAPLLWIGRISYGIYLLHWPVFLWLSPARVGWGPWPLFALRMAVTISASVVLFRLIENPVRHGTRIRRPYGWFAAALMALLLLAGDVVVTRDLAPVSQLTLAATAPSTTPTTLPPPPVRVLIVGDELAASVGAGLTGTDGLDVTVAATPTCGLALGGWVRIADGSIERDVDRCRTARDQWVAAATQARPDVVMVMPGLRDAADRRLSAENAWAGPLDPTNDDFLRTEFGTVLDSLVATGVKVVMMTTPHVRNTVSPVAQPVVPPASADGDKALMLAAGELSVIEQGRPEAGFAENDDARIDHLNTMTIEVAASRGVRVLDLGALVRTWPGGEFDPAMRPDGVGISPAAGVEISKWMVPQLRDTTPPPAATAVAPAVAADASLAPAPEAGPRRVIPAGARADVLVVGDSVAHNLAFGLQKWAASGRANARIVNDGQLGCPVARGGSYRFKGDIAFFADTCDWGPEFPEQVAAMRPDVVVLASGIWEVVDRRLPGSDRFRHIGDPVVDQYLLSEFLSAVDVLGSDGATVVLVTQPHIQPGIEQGFQGLPESDPVRTDRLNELLRQVATLRPGVVQIVDLQGWLQQFPDGENDTNIRPDGLHFTDEFVPTVGDWLGPELRRIAEGG